VIGRGQGTRLHPLTRRIAPSRRSRRGKYRIHRLSLQPRHSCTTPITARAMALAKSLIEAFKGGWQFGGMLPDHFVIRCRRQMRNGRLWYQGTADAIFQNSQSTTTPRPTWSAVFGRPHLPYGHPADDSSPYGAQARSRSRRCRCPAIEANQFGTRAG